MTYNGYHVLPLMAYIQTNTYCLSFTSCDDCIFMKDNVCILYTGQYDDIFEVLNSYKIRALKFIELSYYHHAESLCEECYFIGTCKPNICCQLIWLMNRIGVTNDKKEDKI